MESIGVLWIGGCIGMGFVGWEPIDATDDTERTTPTGSFNVGDGGV